MRPLIIERADLQTRAQRYGYATVTLVCWFLWLYLFVPLLALAAWVLGATIVYQTLIQGLDPRGLLQILAGYGSGVAVLLGAYLTWAISSYLRFRGVERRRAAPPAAADELAASHHLTEPALRQLQAIQRVVLSGEDLQRMFAEEAAMPAFCPDALIEAAEERKQRPPVRGRTGIAAA